MAFDIAKETSRVKTDVIEIEEFPQLARLYGVSGVPKTVINNSKEFVGAVSETAFIGYVLEAAGIGESATGDKNGNVQGPNSSR